MTFSINLDLTFPLVARFLFTEWRKISGCKPYLTEVLKAQIVQGKEVKQLAQESNTVENAVDSTSPNATTVDATTVDATTVVSTIADATVDTTEAAPETASTEAASSNTTASDNSVAAQSDNPNIVIPQPELGASLREQSATPTERREVENGRAYEIIFITKAGDADATEASIARLRTLIEDDGGALDNVRTSEVRRLAYAIKREIEGVYTVVNTRFQTQHMAEIDRFFKLEESVLRHMILREEV